MNTTLLFVEIFIAGLQGLVWIALLTLDVIGYDWVLSARIQEFGNWSFLISALIFSFSYSLGIVIDRMVNALFSPWDKKIRLKYISDKKQSFAIMRYVLENEYLNKQLEYTRTRLRIARASALNHLLITVFSIGLISRLDFLSLGEKWRYGGIVGIIGAIFVILFVASWYSLTNTNFNLVAKVNKESSKNKSASRNNNA